MTVDYVEILTPLAVAVVGYLVVLLRSWVLTHTSPTQFAALSSLARLAVESAEQALGNGPGSEKYALASGALTISAKRLGVRLKPEEAIAFINAAVLEFKAYQAQQVAQLP